LEEYDDDELELDDDDLNSTVTNVDSFTTESTGHGNEISLFT